MASMTSKKCQRTSKIYLLNHSCLELAFLPLPQLSWLVVRKLRTTSRDKNLVSFTFFQLKSAINTRTCSYLFSLSVPCTLGSVTALLAEGEIKRRKRAPCRPSLLSKNSNCLLVQNRQNVPRWRGVSQESSSYRNKVLKCIPNPLERTARKDSVVHGKVGRVYL